MQYLLKVPLQRKEPEIHFEACQVDHVHTLSESEFRFFQHNLMLETDFLRDYNLHHAAPPSEGVRNGVLVLSSGSDDGILVCTEGYDYARYSAYVPYAKQILMLKQYPALLDYGKEMTGLADKCIQKAVTVGLPEPYKFSMDALRGGTIQESFNTELLLELLGNRPEVEDMDSGVSASARSGAADAFPGGVQGRLCQAPALDLWGRGRTGRFQQL